MPETVHLNSSPRVEIDVSDAVLAELEATVTSLYVRTNSLFPPIEGQPVVSFVMKDKYGDPRGTYIEAVTTTPMPCPLHVAADILWKGTTKRSQDPEKVPIFISFVLDKRARVHPHQLISDLCS
ncbi:unnamed protein product [Phytophthora fragariaefolia]|uniref:Unnamed protein product n=1 Tax=Phytophthora fragariaefolia TaxID=1490495 RepID=A0A9W7CX50_9STRA|nr:unnamed protein product [Phytophthora fragariaefolia]